MREGGSKNDDGTANNNAEGNWFVKQSNTKDDAKDDFSEADKTAEAGFKMTITFDGSPVGQNHGEGIAKLTKPDGGVGKRWRVVVKEKAQYSVEYNLS